MKSRFFAVGVALVGWLLVLPAVVSAAPDDIPVTVDDTGLTGEYTSLVLDAAGNPVISYYDATDGDLRLVHCNDPSCADGDDTAVTVDDTGDTGLYTSLVLDAAGNPVISYYDATNGDLRLVHCNDPSCADGDDTAVTVDDTGDTGQHTSLELDAAGNPVISYHDASNRDLRLVHCDDPNCTGGGDTPVTVHDSGVAGLYTSLVLDAAGNPVISYHQNQTLQLVHCDDPNCGDGNDTPVTVDVGVAGEYTSLVLDAAGNPVISYYGNLSTVLRLTHCDDPNCTGGGDTAVTVDDSGLVGKYTSLALDAAGNPVISYFDQSNGGLRLVHCNDPSCADGDDTAVTVDDTGDTGLYTSLVLDAAGNPVISYYDSTNGDLRLVHCNDPDCAEDVTGPTGTIALADGQDAATTSGPVEFSITFDEDVTGFDATDLVVSGTAGATAATLTGTGAAYTATVSAIPNLGTVTVALPAGAVQDTVGNDSLAAVLTANTVTITEPDIGPRELTGDYAGMSGIEGSTARLYMAVFNRQPDAGGHAYWINRANNGLTLREMARFFINSPEFVDTYSTLDNAAFVDLLYLNVMNRAGDEGGVRFWNEQLDNGMARSVVVLQFSESPEFKTLTGTT